MIDGKAAILLSNSPLQPYPRNSQILMNPSTRSLLQNLFCASGIALFTASTLHADVKMPAIFGDHMVLQGEMKIPVWGMAEPDEAVTVTLGESTAKTKADEKGKWHVALPSSKFTDKAQVLTVAGRNTLKFEDVLVGDVWVCSGQSNMEFTMKRAHNAATEIPKADDPLIRLFFVTKKTSLVPVDEVTGKWVLCTPETIPSFSAVGYFFAKELRPILKRPMGLIGTYWGGTPAQSWTSLPGLKKEPVLSGYIEAYDKVSADSEKLKEGYEERLAAYKEANQKWKDENGAAFDAEMAQWAEDRKKAIEANQPQPPKPTPAVPQPTAPPSPYGTQNTPTALFNGMVAPLIPYAIKGVIWYQGEANAAKSEEYTTLFPTMIKDWREKWAQGDFPFLFVQLACYKPGGPSWPLLRESQAKTLSVPNTGMASAVDVGNPADIHPADKLDVGHRLALVARHVAYGENIVFSGPMYESMKVEGDKVVIKFKHTGGGLAIGVPPWSPKGDVPPPADSLQGFVIAGEDKKFVPAEAKIEGDKVIVSSAQVPKPVAVRYAWDAVPVCNLYNKEQLPAISFRTNDWK